MILKDFSDYVRDADRVVARFGFVDEHNWWLGFLFDGDLVLVERVPEGDGGTYTVVGNEIAMEGNHGETVVTYDYSLVGPSLTLTALEECALQASVTTHCERDRSKMAPLMLLATDHTFIRSGDKATY